MAQPHRVLFGFGCLAAVERGLHRCVTSDAAHGVEERAPSRDACLINDLLRGHVPAARGLMQVGNERAAQLYLARLPEGQRPPGRKAEEERMRSWVTNKYVKLKWSEPEWRASLTASRLRASKVASAAPGARGRKGQ